MCRVSASRRRRDRDVDRATRAQLAAPLRVGREGDGAQEAEGDARGGRRCSRRSAPPKASFEKKVANEALARRVAQRREEPGEELRERATGRAGGQGRRPGRRTGRPRRRRRRARRTRVWSSRPHRRVRDVKMAPKSAFGGAENGAASANQRKARAENLASACVRSRQADTVIFRCRVRLALVEGFCACGSALAASASVRERLADVVGKTTVAPRPVSDVRRDDTFCRRAGERRVEKTALALASGIGARPRRHAQ